jgi:hypothetical protein
MTNILSTHRPKSYPFGSSIKSRSFSAGSGFRFGFNTQEKDKEIYNNNETYTATFWEYDGRLGRRWNVDPINKHWESSYSCFSNNPMFLIDPNGADTIYASKNTETGKWNITKTQLAKGNDVFRITLGNYSKQFVFSEGEYGERLDILNIENNDKFTLGIYHVSGQSEEGATGFTITPGGKPSRKANSKKRLPDDIYTLTGTGNGKDQSSYKWIQPLINTGEGGGYVGGRGVKIHPAPSKLPETEVSQWTDGCYVVCSDYNLYSDGIIKYNSNLSVTTSKQLNTMLGGTEHYNKIGKNNFPGTDFENGINFKLIQKTGF